MVCKVEGTGASDGQDRTARVEQILLAPAGMDIQSMSRVFDGLPVGSYDAADVYVQRSVSESWSLEDGRVKDAQYSCDEGFGLRVIEGEKVGFAYADGVGLSFFKEALGQARSVIRQGQSLAHPVMQSAKVQPVPSRYPAINPLDAWDEVEKIAFLQALDRRARAADPRIIRVNVSLSGSMDVVLIATPDGRIATDVRPMVSLHVDVVAKHGTRCEKGRSGGGARDAYGFFTQARAHHHVDEAVRKALLNLEAVPAPAGSMPVVLGPGWPAVLLHEAVGHGLESDACRRGSSVFSGRLGERVASPLCTVVDDGTLMGRRGSLAVDDEGEPAACTTLIEEGRLVGYMHDQHNARLMGAKPTGNGRRESYAHAPIPRMTNTYMLKGQDDPAAILDSLEDGLYAVDFSGGQVDVTSGQFVFTTSEAYWVKNGNIQAPVKNATLLGKGADVLLGITMVGHDLALDEGIGVCGKQGQSVPVGVGQPTLKIDALTVGGAQSGSA